MRKFLEFFGADRARDKESFFLALSLECGPPKALDMLYARHLRNGKIKMMSRVAAIDMSVPELNYMLRFAELATAAGIKCEDEAAVRRLHTEYREWYEKHDSTCPF